jgi:hypothetical protein
LLAEGAELNRLFPEDGLAVGRTNGRGTREASVADLGAVPGALVPAADGYLLSPA